MEKGEGSEYWLHRCCMRVQDMNSVWRKMARHDTELGRLLALLASARGWAGSWSRARSRSSGIRVDNSHKAGDLSQRRGAIDSEAMRAVLIRDGRGASFATGDGDGDDKTALG